MKAWRIPLALAIFVGVLALTFPTDALVRWALASALPPGGPRIEFGQASLRPSGIRLAPATLRDAVGYRIAAADWVVAHPSLLGLLGDRSGRPWRATGAAYGGTFHAVLDAEVVELEWRDVDLARVPTLTVAGDRLAGSVAGTATLRDAPAAGGGTLDLQGATWPTAARMLTGADTMPVDAGVWWTLADGRLSLDAIKARGAGVDAKGAGSVRLAPSLGRSTLDIALTLTPGADTPPNLRRLIADLPAPADGAEERRLVITGTIDAPRFEARP